MQTEEIVAPRKRKKWIVLGIAALIVIVAGVNIAVMQSKKNNALGDLKFANATIKELSNTKLISGQVMPGNIETFYADPAKGTVKELFVKEGQTVQKGQKLFSYDNPGLSNQLKQLDIDKKSSSIRYSQGRSKIASFQKQIKSAKAVHAGKDITTPLESQLQDAQYQLQTTKLEMQKNILQEEDLQNKLDDLIVYSSITGVVQKANIDALKNAVQAAGTQVNPIVQIASKDPYIIQGTLTELQKAQMKPNQPITITAKAISNKTWKGKINEIGEYPVADGQGQSIAASGGLQTQTISYYNYKASLDSQDGLSPGYHVAIQVELSTKNMLVIPSSCIMDKGNSRYVYIVKKSKIYKKNIVTGIGDGNSTEVLEGLKAGDKIVKNPSANLYDGLDVKAK